MAEEQNIQPNPAIKEHAEAGLAKEITEVRKPSKLLLVLMAMGPGIVTAMAGNDAGGISTYSTVGAKFGFLTLWIIPIMCLLLVVVQTTATRMGAVTGRALRRSFANASAFALPRLPCSPCSSAMLRPRFPNSQASLLVWRCSAYRAGCRFPSPQLLFGGLS